MRVAIMQPYFLPYIGYFQLVADVDAFVVYDNIKYTKKGWINRNRLLRNNEATVFTLPIQSGSDSLNVVERRLAESFARGKLLALFSEAYRKAPNYAAVMPELRKIIECPEENLFGYIEYSIVQVCRLLEIRTPILKSSMIKIDHELKCQDKVLALCEALGATTYVNSIGGMALYSESAFSQRGINLEFFESKPFEYRQSSSKFVPSLSIVDPLMHCSESELADALRSGYAIRPACEGLSA